MLRSVSAASKGDSVFGAAGTGVWKGIGGSDTCDKSTGISGNLGLKSSGISGNWPCPQAGMEGNLGLKRSAPHNAALGPSLAPSASNCQAIQWQTVGEREGKTRLSVLVMDAAG